MLICCDNTQVLGLAFDILMGETFLEANYLACDMETSNWHQILEQYVDICIEEILDLVSKQPVQ